MEKQYNIDDVIRHKKRAIRKLNNMIEGFISSGERSLIKKADLLSYWIEDYSRYIMDEECFDPARIIRYNRGNIIRANFGFRVGSEMGGLHYAVIIEKNNARNSSVVTVIPLSSTDGRTVHQNNVDLGGELFAKASDRLRGLLSQAQKEQQDIDMLISMMRDAAEKVPVNDQAESFARARSEYEARRASLEKHISVIERYFSEINRMKSGSMAVMNQVTTISKQRIHVPKKSEDFLYGITLSDSAMDKINEKMRENLIF